jgi:hypothetical protein
MLHEKRVSYEQLKSWAMDAYYEGCRDHAVNRGWSHEEVLGYVSYAFEDGFDRVIENIMWQVILLVLCGSWDSERQKAIRATVKNQLAFSSYASLFADVPEDEVKVFTHDLKVLGLL